MIAMDDFVKIEVDKIFPGPVPDQAGVQIKLWHHKLTVDSGAGTRPRSTESF